MEKYGIARRPTDDNIIRCMRFAYWITKATDTSSEYVIFTAFPRQQWLHERASMLRYTYTACLVRYTAGSKKKQGCRNQQGNHDSHNLSYQKFVWG
jgi:hypothetical protein